MKKLFLFLLFFLYAATASSEIMIISNKSVPNAPISRQDVKDIFLGKKLFWNDKTKIIVAIVPKDITTDSFMNEYLNQTVKQYDDYWEKNIFTGNRNVPVRFKNVKQMVDYITTTNGAIGFIDSKTAPANVNVLAVK